MKKKRKYKLSKEIKGVRVKEMFLPPECANRSFEKQTPEYIVIHEVSLGLGRSPENFNMEHYHNYIIQQGLEGRTVGYHYLCGDKEIYNFIPDDEKTHHVGCELNNNSIGIERLICKGISYCDALHNQAKLAATLMVKYNIPIDRVISHKTAQAMCGIEQPKQCPNRLIAGQYGGFSLFYKEIKKCLEFGDLFYEVLGKENEMKLVKNNI